MKTQPGVFRGGVLAATPAGLAEQFGLPPEAGLGALAQRAASATARQQQADLGLALVVDQKPDDVQIGIGLAGPAGGERDEFGFGGNVLLLSQWAATSALDRLRRWLLADSGKIGG